MDDTGLLREYVEKGSQPAFARLVEQHVDLVYSAALRRVGGDPHRANEVTQMVFTDLARKAASLTNHPLLAGWLHQSTRWAAAGLRRTEQRRVAHEAAAAVEHSDLQADQAAGWVQLAPLLDEALDSLNGPDREAVLLRYFNDQPFAVIGAKLGLTENAARMRVERALEKLHTLLAKRGATSTAAALAMVLTQNAVAAAPAGMATTATVSAMSGAASAAVAATVGNLFMTKLQLGVLGLLIAGLVVGLSLQHAQTKRVEEQIAALSRHRATLKTLYTTLEKKHHERQAALRILEADAARLPPLAPLTPQQQERVRLDTLIRKGELDQTYPALFRHLRLSPAGLDTFKGLLVERNQFAYDANKLAKDLGFTFASNGEAKAVRESGFTEINRRIAALLGPESFAYFKTFEDTLPYRMKLAGFLEKYSTPENDILLDRLTALYVETCPTLFEEPNYRDSWLSGLPEAVLQAAADLITPQQRQNLKLMYQEDAAKLRMIEIATAAAKAGKLKLTKQSALDFPAPTTSKP